jgi:hypothetical protein
MYGGYIEAPPPAGAVGTADTASYTDFDVSSAVLPFVTMNGSNRTLRGVHLYASGGIQSMCNYFLNSNETANWGATGWQISDLYCEGTNTMSGEIARFMSGPYHVAGADMGAGVSTQAWIQFKGSGSSWFGGEGAPLLVSGNSNKFDHVSGTITDAGQDNVFENQSISGTNNYMGRRYNPSARPFRDAIGKLDGSAIASGSMTAPYLNNSDLFTICDDWAFGVFSGSVSGSCVYDPTGTEISKSYLQSATATNQFDLVGNAQGAAWQNAWNGAPRIIGTHVPLTKATAYVMAQCVGAATCSTIGRVADAQTSSPLGFGTLNFTNAWSVQSFPVDFTSATVGDVINLRLTNWMNTGTNYRVAYFAIQPVNQDEHTWLAANGLPADPANPATLLRPVDKTGAGLTTGPTSSVNLDMAVFDGTTGKIKDGGPAPAAMLSNVPTWLQFLGDGSSGAYNCTSGTCAAVGGEYWYSSFNLSSGTTLPVSNAFAGNDAMIVHSPGTCTIAGMVTASPNTGGGSNNGAGLYGGGSGGGGGGTGAGAAGNPALAGATGAGAAGAAGGGPGGNGSSTGAYIQKILLASGLASSGTSTGLAAFGGAAGGAGGSGGGAGGKGGGLVIFDCQTINFTGTIDVSGQNGTTASGNNTGGGGGGAGGVVILRSPNMTNSGTFNVTGGSGGGCAAFTGCGAGGSGATGWSKVYAQ